MLETSTRETTLSLNAPAGTTVRLINDVPHEVTDEGLRVFLGDAYSGQTHELVLRLDLPARPLGETLNVATRLDYHDVATRASASAMEPLVYTIANPSQVAEQPVDEEVLTIAARLEVEGAKLRAMKLEREGQHDQAKVLLRGTAQAVAAFAAAPAAQTAQAELADLARELERGLTKARRKAVTYAAYRAHRSRRDYKKK
jgi:hypothetical protein